LSDAFAEGVVEVVFYLGIGATRDFGCDGGPFVTEFVLKLEQSLSFFFVPFCFVLLGLLSWLVRIVERFFQSF
jgi:hypothetical protein